MEYSKKYLYDVTKKTVLAFVIALILIMMYVLLGSLYASQKYRFIKSDGTIDVDMIERSIQLIENNYQPKKARIFNHVPSKTEIGGEGYSVVYATATKFAYIYQIINGTTYSFRLDKN